MHGRELIKYRKKSVILLAYNAKICNYNELIRNKHFKRAENLISNI